VSFRGQRRLGLRVCILTVPGLRVGCAGGVVQDCAGGDGRAAAEQGGGGPAVQPRGHRAIKQLAARPDAWDVLAESIAPSTYGHRWDQEGPPAPPARGRRERTSPTERTSEGQPRRALPTGHCSQGTAYRALLTGHCSQGTPHRALLSTRLGPSACPLTAGLPALFHSSPLFAAGGTSQTCISLFPGQGQL